MSDHWYVSALHHLAEDPEALMPVQWKPTVDIIDLYLDNMALDDPRAQTVHQLLQERRALILGWMEDAVFLPAHGYSQYDVHPEDDEEDITTLYATLREIAENDPGLSFATVVHVVDNMAEAVGRFLEGTFDEEATDDTSDEDLVGGTTSE